MHRCIALLALGGTMGITGVAWGQAAATGDTAPPRAFAITGGADLTTDYRFRGISQSDRRVAIQGTATLAHRSGFYASFWGSSIDDYVEDGANAEIDLSAGYRRTFSGTTVDGGMLYYYYPGASDRVSTKSDFFEPYLNVSHTFGPIGAKVGGNFAWKQHGLGTPNSPGNPGHGGIYAYGELTATVPTLPVTVTGHLGHSFVRNYITFDERYTDWSATAAYSWHAFTVSIAYVDTSKHFLSYPDGGGHNRNISGSGAVGAVAVAF